MVLGQSCATAAALAMDQGKGVQELDYEVLRGRLEKDGQVLGTRTGSSDSATTPVLKLTDVRKIWDGGRHNAFTDLIRYRGKLLCTFREAGGHVPASHEEDGRIRILESADGTTWTSVALLESADPGTPLSTIEDDERATDIFCEVFHRLQHLPAPIGKSVPVHEAALRGNRAIPRAI